MDTWTLGLTMTVMGMGMVFLVLAILVVLVYLFNWLYDYYLSRRPVAREEVARLVGEDTMSETGPAGVSADKVAVITAAIAATLGSGGPQFRLVRIAQSGRGLSWAAAGRQEIINSRQEYLMRKE